MTSNPFFTRSPLPYELPEFAKIGDEDYLPAFERGMAEQLAEIAAITSEVEAPTFGNVIVALECSGALLKRVSNVFDNIAGADSSARSDAIAAEVSPKLAAHTDAIHLDPKLFDRIETLYARRDELDIDAEERRLLEQYRLRFRRAGAGLDAEKQGRLRAINAELAAAGTEFGQANLAASNAATLILDDVSELAGLDASTLSSAAQNAESLGHPGKWALRLQNTSNQPVLAGLSDREVRRRVMVASLGRGFGTEGITGALATRIAALRAERAALLGYPDHAAYAVEDQTAGTVSAVEDLLARLVPPAVANARGEAAELAAAMREGTGQEVELRSWDWQFWSEKLRVERFSFDAAALRPYLELEQVLRDGVFYAAEQVYGITVRERGDLIGYHPEVRVFEVFDADGEPLGLFLGDFFTRPSKRGGAWMNELVGQSKLLGQKPVVVNNLNIVKPPEGEAALLTWGNVRTLFHEFGHALHGLFSNVGYPFFSGTEVPRDFVEFPSQVNEMWMSRPEILANYAKHFETGAPMPAELVERMAATERFGEGFRTVEYLAAALLDWAWHRISAADVRSGVFDPGVGAEAFEDAALRKAGIALAAIPPRYRTGYFAHIFSGGYAASYYSYIWSEVLDADTTRWFTDGDASIREKGERFRRELLSRGGSVDPLGAFEAIRGRAPEIEPLLIRRGLTV
ncbi:M3 family metallopeptidase [Nocardia callitridis]|uniref:M3 family metallopeptidase n=1 Tax=Nocardia callitridis TaxID=648753 RepID=A0ABP9KSR4_9NOCA